MRQTVRSALVVGMLLTAFTPYLARAGGHAGEDPPERPHERPAGVPGGAPGPGGDGEAPPSSPPPRVVSISGRGPGPTVAPDHVIAQFDSDLAGWQRRQIAAAAGATTFKVASTGRFAKLGVADGDSPQALVRRLSGLSGVRFAEVDPLARGLGIAAVQASGAGAGSAQQVGQRQQGGAKRSPSDPLFARQWPLQRIHLPETLDLDSRLGEGVIVAVIDSGVAFGDGATYPSRRGLDLGATRFLPGFNLVEAGPPYDEGVVSGSGDFIDINDPRFGHGTFVAAQIAAGIDNGLGAASIAPRATILPIRVLDDFNFASFSDVAEGIDLAVAAGARVINLSLGGPEPSGLLEQAILRAHAAGVVVVASAGNGGDGQSANGDVLYPARYPTVIAVGASGFDDHRASYSNFGPGLDLMAPAGDDVDHFVLPDIRDAALSSSFLHDPVTGQTIYASFWANGTSFAAPQVSAAAALFVALGVNDPDAVRELLLATARDLQDPGLDIATGHGLLDLLEAHRGLGFGF